MKNCFWKVKTVIGLVRRSKFLDVAAKPWRLEPGAFLLLTKDREPPVPPFEARAFFRRSVDVRVQFQIKKSHSESRGEGDVGERRRIPTRNIGLS